MIAVSVYFHDKATGEQVRSEEESTCEEILALLSRLTSPESSLITQMPSGLGVDFVVEGKHELSVELYARDISHAYVTKLAAERIVRRAFERNVFENVTEQFSDLVSDWNW